MKDKFTRTDAVIYAIAILGGIRFGYLAHQHSIGVGDVLAIGICVSTTWVAGLTLIVDAFRAARRTEGAEQ